jgi:hypothetical protein
MHNDYWSGRSHAAMIPPFMLPRQRPATEGEGAALYLPGGLPAPGGRDPRAPNGRSGYGR